MSEENVEIVRTITAAFVQGDYETALKSLDPEVEMVGPTDVTAGGACGVATARHTWQRSAAQHRGTCSG